MTFEIVNQKKKKFLENEFFVRFPVDTQTCRYHIWPMMNRLDEIKLKFMVEQNPKVTGNNLDYDLTVDFSQAAESWYWKNANNNVSRIWFQMELKRKPWKYFIESFLPSGLFVIMSWVLNDIFNQS